MILKIPIQALQDLACIINTWAEEHAPCVSEKWHPHHRFATILCCEQLGCVNLENMLSLLGGDGGMALHLKKQNI